MKNPRHPNHVQASKNGGLSQTQKVHYCQLCDQAGRGNRFYSFHVRDQKCEGRGVKNYYSKKNQRDIF